MNQKNQSQNSQWGNLPVAFGIQVSLALQRQLVLHCVVALLVWPARAVVLGRRGVNWRCWNSPHFHPETEGNWSNVQMTTTYSHPLSTLVSMFFCGKPNHEKSPPKHKQLPTPRASPGHCHCFGWSWSKSLCFLEQIQQKPLMAESFLRNSLKFLVNYEGVCFYSIYFFWLWYLYFWFIDYAMIIF